jgi:hypothetical protein
MTANATITPSGISLSETPYFSITIEGRRFAVKKNRTWGMDVLGYGELKDDWAFAYAGKKYP